jgi:hypothetical protein
VTVLILKFLSSLLEGGPAVQPHEVNNFVLQNARLLANRLTMLVIVTVSSIVDLFVISLWQAYGLLGFDLRNLRICMLLRILDIDSTWLEELIKAGLHPSTPWEHRSVPLVLPKHYLSYTVN